jgi:hypothetical protein
MSKKRSGEKTVSARKLFVTRIDRLVSEWRSVENEPDIDSPPEKTSQLFQRMRSDDRMRVVWEALAEISDEDDYVFFLDWAAQARNTAAATRSLASRSKRRSEEFRDLADMARLLQQFYEDGDRVTVGTFVPGLAEQLKTAHTLLVEAQRSEANNLREHQRRLSRKSARGRVEFIRDMARVTKEVLGTPHYEVVAALTNVVFNEDTATADAVRKIIDRTPDDWAL